MDILVIGVYDEVSVQLVEYAAKLNDIEVVWSFDKYKLESEIGINDLKTYYGLFKTGVLIEYNNSSNTFWSYPLINEISEYYVSTEWDRNNIDKPRLFNFFADLEKNTIHKMILAFADEWNEETTVKVEKIKMKDIIQRLNSEYVWCYGYRNLRTNTEIRDDFHPLLLEIEK